jgi:hypothetical protein
MIKTGTSAKVSPCMSKRARNPSRQLLATRCPRANRPGRCLPDRRRPRGLATRDPDPPLRRQLNICQRATFRNAAIFLPALRVRKGGPERGQTRAHRWHRRSHATRVIGMLPDLLNGWNLASDDHWLRPPVRLSSVSSRFLQLRGRPAPASPGMSQTYQVPPRGVARGLIQIAQCPSPGHSNAWLQGR